MRLRLPSLAVAAAAVVGISLAPQQPAAAAPTAGPEKYLSQELTWKPCTPQLPDVPLECTKITVPRNWKDPDSGHDIQVAVSRLPAGDPSKRRGAMLLNPGGPGGSGLFMPLAFRRQPIANAYDLIGFDPRGVGRSTQITCQTAEEYENYVDINFHNRSPQHIDYVLDVSRRIARHCRERSGPLLRYVNTYQTVRDMDLIRGLLGEDKINYLGYSAGTWLGAHYATTFPDRVGRFVLDSNVQFTTTWQRSFRYQPRGFQRRFEEDFLPWMAKHEEVYHYGDTWRKARANFREQRRELVEGGPLKVTDDFTLTAGDFDSGTSAAMYTASLFPELARALSILASFDDATQAEREHVAKVFSPFFSPSLYAVFYAVTCNDTDWKENPNFYVNQSRRLGRAYPLIGWSWLGGPCPFWPYEQPPRQHVTGKGLPPFLMINTEHDPATPIEGALAAARRVRNEQFVLVKDAGNHGVYGGKNECVNSIVNSYFLGGKTPGRFSVCDGVPLPDPTAPRTQAADQRPDNILQRIEELNRKYHARF